MSADDALVDAGRLLAERFGDRLRHHHPLGAMTTYRVGGVARLFVEAATVDDLVAVADTRRETGVSVLLIGRGSNMLVADDGFDGIAVSIAELAHDIDLPDGAALARCVEGDPAEVTAGGGAALPVVARQTAAAGVRGFEWAVGIPGSIGGAVRMNAGGHGADMAACVLDVGVFDLEQPSRGVFRLTNSELGLRFRASGLASGHVVLDARLSLQVGDAAAALDQIHDVVHWRREHQPGGRNCGSVFVNPVPGKVASGALIDGLGLRGFRIGTAYVSEMHANFIQADEGGSAADVRSVMEAVRERVAAETGYRLRSEVRLVGFDDIDPLSFEEVG